MTNWLHTKENRLIMA